MLDNVSTNEWYSLINATKHFILGEKMVPFSNVSCHYSGPIVDPITGKGGGPPCELDIFSINHVGTGGLALEGDRCWPTCPHLFKVFTNERRHNRLCGPLTLVVHAWVAYRLRPTQQWSNNIIHIDGNTKIIFVCFLHSI